MYLSETISKLSLGTVERESLNFFALAGHPNIGPGCAQYLTGDPVNDIGFDQIITGLGWLEQYVIPFTGTGT